MPWNRQAHYRVLPTDEPIYTDKAKPNSLAPGTYVRRLSRFPRRRLVSLLVTTVVLCLLLALATIGGRKFAARRPRTELVYPKAQDLGWGDRKFVIVIPTNSPSPDLCKVISSAIALGYPAPIIVNWDKTFDDPDVKFGGSHIGKIYGTLEYLDAATAKDANPGDKLGEEDLVIMVDAYDVWFQLPPEVLLQRFHEANQLANGRLAQEWGGSGDVPMKQTIISSAQKRCFPDNDRPGELHCDAVPNSTMREDVYGDNTDDEWDISLHSIRPKFINSGTIMGPVGDMKRLFRHVTAKVEKTKAEGLRVESDQGLLGEVFGEQSLWRNLRRQWKNEPAGVPDEAIVMMQDSWEYHMGLDYEQGLFVSTYYEEYDGRIIPLNDKGAIEKASNSLGISPVRLDGVPEDLEDVSNPLVDLYKDRPPGEFEWGNLPLYADFFTTAVPAVLHHNAKKYGAKKRRTTWWDKTWYFPYLRDLVELNVRPGALKPLARLSTSAGELVYWPPTSNTEKRKARVFNKETMKGEGLHQMEFGDVCIYPGETEESEKHWYDEVYRDGKGAL